MSAPQVEISVEAAREAIRTDCTEDTEDTHAHLTRPTLLFMSGARRDSAPWYSQRVREELWRLHHNASGVVFRQGEWSLGEMRKATFCLCPSGWGFGWRTYLALATLCVPVIIQPLVRQAFHDLLPYERMALFFDPSDVARLPDLLRAVPPQRVCELRATAARYYRAVMWEPEGGGLAYDMLQLSLCRRAVALHRRLRRGSSSDPEWAACAHVTPEDIMSRG